MNITLDDYNYILEKVENENMTIKELKKKLYKLDKYNGIEMRSTNEFTKIFIKHGV
jgi:hypothetical protein